MSDAVTVDLERWGRAKIAGAFVVSLVLGGGALVAAATGGIDGGSASTVIAIVFGVLVLLIGCGLCIPLLVDPPHATLTLDPAGLRHIRGRRVDWTLSWADVATAAVTHSDFHLSRGGISTAGGFQHPSTHLNAPRDWLHLVPTPAAAARPELARALGADPELALDLGPDARQGEAVRAALTAFAPPAVRPS